VVQRKNFGGQLRENLQAPQVWEEELIPNNSSISIEEIKEAIMIIS